MARRLYDPPGEPWLEDHIAATEGVECRKDAYVIDETPAAYKDLDAVMLAQADVTMDQVNRQAAKEALDRISKLNGKCHHYGHDGDVRIVCVPRVTVISVES